MRKEKLYNIADGTIAAIGILALASVIIGVILLFIDNDICYDMGLFFVIFPFPFILFFLIIYLLTGAVVCVDNETITVKVSLLFQIQLKEKRWADLQGMMIKELNCGRGSYAFFICLYFEGCNLYWTNSKSDLLFKSPGTIIVAASKKNKRKLQKYLPEQFKFWLD